VLDHVWIADILPIKTICQGHFGRAVTAERETMVDYSKYGPPPQIGFPKGWNLFPRDGNFASKVLGERVERSRTSVLGIKLKQSHGWQENEND